MQSFYQKLKHLRIERGWSQEDVAKKLGLTKVTYSYIERARVDIKLTRIEEIAALFDTTLSHLLSVEALNDIELAKAMANFTTKIAAAEKELENLQSKINALKQELAGR